MLTRHLGNSRISTILVRRTFPLRPPIPYREAPECLKRGTKEHLPIAPFTFQKRKVKSELFYSFYQALEVTKTYKERITGEIRYLIQNW